MKKVLGWIGFFIGWFLSLYLSDYRLGLFFMPLGAIIGRLIGKSIDESREQDKINKERMDKEMKQRQDRLFRVHYLISTYPEAAKDFYKRRTGENLNVPALNRPVGVIGALWTTDENLNITALNSLTDNDLILLLSLSEESYQVLEEKLNPSYRAKREAERAESAKRREAERLAAERKKEEERLAAERKRVAEQLEQKRKEDEKRRAISMLPSCVENWSSHSNSTLKHKYYYEYYPYGINKDDATSSMWNTWKLVWHFKNDPDKNISSEDHEYALRVVIRKVEDTLRSTFGASTEYLTLVCMTASTQRKTEMRFREFAETVCKDLKMTNAYPFINVKEGGSAKHEGGDGAQEISLDRGFFNGKYVVLFDDVRTTGRSLETMRTNLERLGAKVLCAITIAQTTH